MRHLHIVVLAVVVSLLAVAVACDNGDDAPAATDTPAADAPTATVAIDPTTPPDATATPPGLTSTPRPDVEGACPVDDEAFCELAGVIDQGIQPGHHPGFGPNQLCPESPNSSGE